MLDSATGLLATYDALPLEVRRVVAATSARILIASATGLWGKFRAWIFPNARAIAIRSALNEAIAVTLANHPQAISIGLSRALSSGSLANLVVDIVRNPNQSLDRTLVENAFEDSIFEPRTIGIDAYSLIVNLQGEYLSALRLSDSPDARQLHAGTRIEQIHTNQQEIQAVVLGMSSGIRTAPTPSTFETRLAEVREQMKVGDYEGAQNIARRLLADCGEIASPEFKARVVNNIGACQLELQDFESATASFQKALSLSGGELRYSANLVQAEMLSGRHAEALERATAILAIEPLNAAAWAVRLQSGVGAFTLEDIPEVLRKNDQILVALSYVASERNRSEAVSLLREALRHGTRQPKLLIGLAELLYGSLFPRRSTDSIPTLVTSEIRGLIHEIEDPGVDRLRDEIRARIAQLRGGLAALEGAADGGSSYFKEALGLSGGRGVALFGLVDGQLRKGNAAAALFLLESATEADRNSIWCALRANAYSILGRGSEIDADVRAVTDGVIEEGLDAAITIVVSAVERAKRFDLVEAVLSAFRKVAPPDMVHLQTARFAAQQQNRALADSEFAKAVEHAVGADVPRMKLEYAQYSFSLEDFERVCALCSDGDVWQLDETATRMYGFALLEINQLEELESVLAHVKSRATVAAWAYDLEARLADKLNDPVRVIASLESLLSLRDVPTIRVRLGWALSKAKETRRANAVIESLSEREDLEVYDATNLAVLLLELGKIERALYHAYHALRAAPDDARIQQACVMSVFVRASTNQSDLDHLFQRTEIGPETWFKIRSRDGEEIEYTVYSKGTTDVRRNEFLVSDSRVSHFLGLAVGGQVVLRSGTIGEREFTVTELKSAQLQTFQQAMQTFQYRFPGENSIQSVPMSSEGKVDIGPLLRILGARQRTFDELLSEYREKKLPLGVISTAMRSSIRRFYKDLLSEDVEIFVADPTTTVRLRAQSLVFGADVVLTGSALVSLAELNLVGILPQVFNSVRVPQSLVDEIRLDIDEYSRIVANGGVVQAYLSEGLPRSASVSKDAAVRFRKELEGQLETLYTMSTVVARPATNRSDFENLREIVGESSFDAIELSSSSHPIYADDFGLIQVATSHSGCVGFCTFDLLLVAQEHGIVTAEDAATSVLKLLQWGQVSIPVDASFLFDILLQEGFELRPHFLTALAAGVGKFARFDDAIRRVVELVRRIALFPLARGAAVPVTLAALRFLVEGRPARTVVQFLRRELNSELRLLPLILDEINRAIEIFESSK